MSEICFNRLYSRNITFRHHLPVYGGLLHAYGLYLFYLCTRPVSSSHSMSPYAIPPPRLIFGTITSDPPPFSHSLEPSHVFPAPSFPGKLPIVVGPPLFFRSSHRILFAEWEHMYTFLSELDLNSFLFLTNTTGHFIFLEIVELIVTALGVCWHRYRLR